MMQLIEKVGSTCVEVGECGMDSSNKNNIEMADQVEVMQVMLAIRLNKPLVLRGAEKLDEVDLPAN
jgi:Tat protein secretion system quality control protein TatD with DNase activity